MSNSFMPERKSLFDKIKEKLNKKFNGKSKAENDLNDYRDKLLEKERKK
jgi:predicted KAP-like P-loop ATPase